MSKKNTIFQIKIKLYFYKSKFIIKVLWKVIEIKKITFNLSQKSASNIVPYLVATKCSQKNLSSKLSQLIFYYHKKLIINLNYLYFF